MKKTAINNNKLKNLDVQGLQWSEHLLKGIWKETKQESTFALYCESNISDDVTTLLAMRQY